MSAVSPKEIHDGLIMSQMYEHYKEAQLYFKENQMVALCLQGSQNYGLDYEGSDVDTKLILVPSFKDIALNKKPVSTTHIRDNNEHIDWKDIRLYFETFRKQNLNFLEILFTPYYMVNPLYAVQWVHLIDNREKIARMNPYRAVKSMKGIALEKYFAMEHRYPSKVDLIDKFGYDGKQISHLIRVDDYLERYIAGESYEDCLRPTPAKVDEIMAYKLQQIPLEIARERAKEVIAHVEQMTEDFCNTHKEHEDEVVRELLENVQYEIMELAIKEELRWKPQI